MSMGDGQAPDVFRPGLFDSQVALITGGGTGIGFGIAQLLAELGATVVLASRSQAHLDAAVDQLRAAGGRANSLILDVRDAAAVKTGIGSAADRFGRLDILVNNAAGNFYVPSESMSANAWRSVIEIDLSGTFFCSQAAMPLMRDRGGGRIVNVSMTLHYRGWPLMAHATAAKAGVDALTRTLALEWARYGIRVNAVAPGPIPTEGVKKAFAAPPGSAQEVFSVEGAMDDYARRAIPLARMGAPRDIANMVAFLASPGADWITGAIMVVDGGEWLQKSPN